jgi:hypothetical protein
MFARVHDMFVIVNFLSNNWELKHVTVNLLKVIEVSGATMVLNYELSLTIALNLVVSYKSLGMLKSFHGSSFRHALSKVYYYASINKICWGLSCAYIEGAQVDI